MIRGGFARIRLLILGAMTAIVTAGFVGGCGGGANNPQSTSQPVPPQTAAAPVATAQTPPVAASPATAPEAPPAAASAATAPQAPPAATCTLLGQQLLTVSAEHPETTRLVSFDGVSSIGDDDFVAEHEKFTQCAIPIVKSLEDELTSKQRLQVVEKKAADRGISLAGSDQYLKREDRVGWEALKKEQAAADHQRMSETLDVIQAKCGRDPAVSIRRYSYVRGEIKAEDTAASSIFLEPQKLELLGAPAVVDVRSYGGTFYVRRASALGIPLIDDATNKDQLVCRITFSDANGRSVSGVGVWNLRGQTVAFHPR